MHSPKIKLCAHTYQDTTEVKIKVINKQCKDTVRYDTIRYSVLKNAIETREI